MPNGNGPPEDAGPPEDVRERLPETAAVSDGMTFRREVRDDDGRPEWVTFRVERVKQNGGTIIQSISQS